MTSCEFDANAPSAHVPLVARCGNGSINMRQGNILNEATAVSLATFPGEVIRASILIVVLHQLFPVDVLAFASEKDPRPARILLFGDSATKQILSIYTVGGAQPSCGSHYSRRCRSARSLPSSTPLFVDSRRATGNRSRLCARAVLPRSG